MDDFVKVAIAEGGDATTAKMLWRSGVTEALLNKAKERGLTYKDLEEMYGLFGQTFPLVAIELLGRIKK